MNLLGAFLKSYEQTLIFHVSVAAILDLCALYCFKVFYLYFFEFLIPKLGVDTKMKWSEMKVHFFESYKQSWIFQVGLAAILDFYFLWL